MSPGSPLTLSLDSYGSSGEGLQEFAFEVAPLRGSERGGARPEGGKGGVDILMMWTNDMLVGQFTPSLCDAVYQ